MTRMMKRLLLCLFLTAFMAASTRAHAAGATSAPLAQHLTATGAATLVLGSRPYVEIICTNGAGCPITVATYVPVSSTTQISAQITIVCLNAYLAGATCQFANQNGLLVLPAGAVTLDHTDVLRLDLSSAGWIAESFSNNVPPTPTPTATATPTPTATATRTPTPTP